MSERDHILSRIRQVEQTLKQLQRKNGAVYKTELKELLEQLEASLADLRNEYENLQQ